MSDKSIETVFEENRDKLMAISGVVGIGIGLDEQENLCIKVYLEKMDEDVTRNIPRQLEGFPLAIDVGGNIIAH